MVTTNARTRAVSTVTCSTLLVATAQAIAGGVEVTFGTPQSVASNIPVFGLGVGDLNLDGRPDVAGAAFSTTVYRNVQGMLVPDDDPLPFGSAFEATLRIADVSGDGLPDIIAAGSGSNLTVLQQQPNGEFAVVDTGIDMGTYVPRFELGRFNDDGLPDVVTSNPFAIHLNAGGGRFQLVGEAELPPNSARVFAANMNGDGLDDVILISGFPPTIRVLRNVGGGALALSAEYPAPPSVNAGNTGLAEVDDFNGDGLSDLFVASHEADNNEVIIRFGQPDATLSEAAHVPTMGPAQRVASGDLNGDGHADIVVAFTSSASVLLGRGDGTFAPGGATSIPAQGTMQSVFGLAISDIDGDERNDLVMSRYSLFVIPNTTPPAISTADVNGDGTVNVDDLIAVILSWGACSNCTPTDCPADIDGSCAVDVDDLIAVILNWG